MKEQVVLLALGPQRQQVALLVPVDLAEAEIRVNSLH